MLAIKVTDDGKGIIANDPATGGQVILSYDAATKTVGGITSILDAKSQTFVPLANSQSNGGVSSQQSFVPATFFAVTVK